MIEEIISAFNNSRGEHVPKQGNEYNVTDILQCRRKLELIREGKQQEVIETDATRQGKISNFVHRSMQAVLETEGWEAERKFTKSFGKYTLHMRSDASFPYDWLLPDEILEIKCPGYARRRLPDYWLFQIEIYLNITGAEKCTLIVLGKNDFFEKEFTEPMKDEDVLYLLENGKSPWYEFECKSCWYKKYCDLEGGSKK